jgi:NADP-dependent 3-hydroxy acid dehydrogenase YdfG
VDRAALDARIARLLADALMRELRAEMAEQHVRPEQFPPGSARSCRSREASSARNAGDLADSSASGARGHGITPSNIDSALTARSSG